MLRFITLAIAIAVSGCTHHQLRYNTTRQAKTVADVHTQQVLDNLAKFVANPSALPHFSFPNAGASGVQDSAGSTGSFSFSPYRLTNWGFGLSGGRVSNESYTMTPISDPKKLDLMRCVYQRAVAAHTCRGEALGCPDCSRRLNSFYLGKPNPGQTSKVTWNGDQIYLYEFRPGEFVEVFESKNELGETVYCRVEDGGLELAIETEIRLAQKKKRLRKLYITDSVEEQTRRNGQVTVACIHGNCWFCVGRKCDIPKHLSCHCVGHFRGTYIWVPEEHQDQLTKLTLTILDIALNNPPSERTKEVIVYLDSYGDLTTKAASSYQVTATIPISSSIDSVQARNRKDSEDAVQRAQLSAVKMIAELNDFATFASQKKLGGKAAAFAAKAKTARINLDAVSDLSNRMIVRQFLLEIANTSPTDVGITDLPKEEREEATVELNNLKAASTELIASLDILTAVQLSEEGLDRQAQQDAEVERSEIQMLPSTPTPVPGAGYLQFQQNLDALAPR